MVLGSTATARGSLEYTYASMDKDATLAAYTTDDFIWGTGWSGHRLDLGVRISDRASSHVVGQLQKFKDSPPGRTRGLPQPATAGGEVPPQPGQRAAGGGALAARLGGATR